MWIIPVKPKSFYVDENKPKIVSIVLFPKNHEPNVGITYNVAYCSEIPSPGSSYLNPTCVLDNVIFLLSGTEYNNWGQNDLPYLENIILSRLEFERP